MQLRLRDLASQRGRNYLKRVIEGGVVDAVIIVAAYAVAVSIWTLNASVDAFATAGFIVFIALVLLAMLFAFGVYRRIWSRTSGHGITVMINAVVTATVVVIPVVFLS